MRSLRSLGLFFGFLLLVELTGPGIWADQERGDTGNIQADTPKLCMPVSYRHAVLLKKPPVFVGMLGDRYSEVDEALKGWNQSGVPLTGQWSGKWEPVPCGDDSGLFYFVPLLARTFDWNTDLSLNVFYATILISATAISLIGFFLFGGRREVFFATIIVILAAAYMTYKAGDVYLVQGSVTMMAVPWIYYWYKKKRIKAWDIAGIFALGTGLGVAQWIRSQAAVPLVLLAMVLFAFSSLKSFHKLLITTTLLLGIILPLAYAKILLHRRDTFLAAQSQDFHPVLERHLLWHTVYVGLGYLSNPYVHGWKDTLAADYVQSVNPAVIYGSREYEAILKKRVLYILKKDPKFIFYTVTAKLGTLIIFVLFFMNTSLIKMSRQYKCPTTIAFGITILYSALPGLVAIPAPEYVISMIVICLYYWPISFIENKITKPQTSHVEFNHSTVAFQ